jgi:transposase
VKTPAPASHLFGPRAILEPEQIVALVADVVGGASAEGVAERYGVSRRTVYRYCHITSITRLHIEGWSAQFAIRPGHPPRQLTSWER